MINRVILVGRLTRNPELKYTANGIANLQFSLAVNRSYIGANGEKQADFISCMAWRGTAENMAKFLKKGALIGIEGRIETSSYQTTDGSTRYSTYVVCDHVQFLESKKSQGQSQSSPQQEAGFQTQPTTFDTPFSQPGTNPFVPNSVPSTYTPGQSQASSMINIDDDDLPF
ncbi:single-stranded DNA-binding protein [Turicibacter sanguinis]|uniref:single-stranded DNA-binding protein n=1 Tax=Turicibacter sanguinis TaxID=154288 RepID=UPI00232C154D|nr:single-stranded DNA-binding protein [Turicibacter sanguinis]MDB8575575.1 single-stranded DNA-binding protein [Turicibacter sanguinis]MDB8578789.1 single-stranded DNA-binding protein [Turicibacter sanguinis]MDB8585245.1 single-stranded DNA-binding protein [Turicibacter sanguinis]MDB8588248.1 single-stranded DNA-binding protein [Turicibacter sanguinis]MDB8599060.1 single-stranded DNA-binding protein [Turicibacter sanguinis]